MGWKDFLKPTIWKIILFLVFSISLFINWSDCLNCPDSFEYTGLPLPVFISGGFVGYLNKLMPSNLIIDLAFWYLLSCLIFWLYNKVKKK